MTGITLILWLIGFIPQILIALLLASWFVDIRMIIHAKQFFKVVIYLPNLIMASAFAMLFFTMFSTNGPINSILTSMGMKNPIDFMGSTFGTRSLIGLMNFFNVVWQFHNYAYGSNYWESVRIFLRHRSWMAVTADSAFLRLHYLLSDRFLHTH